ncbi:unnamed protein product, partial [Meganyctiphanes norvegica]
AENVMLFKDYMTADDMFDDTYFYEDKEDALYMVHATEDSAGLDVVVQFGLEEIQFETVSDYIKEFYVYIEALGEKLIQNGKYDEYDKLGLAEAAIFVLLQDFENLRFFKGSSMDPVGMTILLEYKFIDGEDRPVLYYIKYGLE